MKVLFWLSIGLDKHVTSEHLISSMIESVCKQGNSVHIIQKGTGGELPSIPETLACYPVTTSVIPFRAADKGNFIARYFTELKYIYASRKYIQSDFDAVFIQSTTVAGYAVKIIRSKNPNATITFNVQDIFPDNAAFSGNINKNGIIYHILAKSQQYSYRHSDHIITISEDMKDTLIIDGAEEKKIEVIYNWSYQDMLYTGISNLHFSHFFDPHFYNVVYAGNIGIMQNVDILVEAARIMKNDTDVWFHIIGNGVYKEKLQKKVEEYERKNISFWPMQPPELAPVIYSSADVNIIPLVKNIYRTALPSKTATCLACSKPIIFAIGRESKFGQKVMKETDCFVVDPDQPNYLVEAIRKSKEMRNKRNSGDFFLKYCSKTENSKRYAEIITTLKE